MGESYSGFAYIYDQLIQDINYDVWVDYIESIFHRYDAKPTLVLDLACGTGNVSTRMAQRGYDMIGVDMSEDMLNVAINKASKEALDILYLNQDMRDFELYGTVDAIICLLDSVNYITDKQDLIQTFKLVKNYLNVGGLFIFDINTAYKLQEVLGDHTFVVDEDNIFYVWENHYDEAHKICDFFLTFFIKEDTKYERVDEWHQEKAYEIAEIKNSLREVGLNCLAIYNDLSFDMPNDKSERIFFIVQKQQEISD